MIVGRISLLVGKAIAIKPDGSSRELSLGDQIESDELISVAQGGKVEITANGQTISIGSNETWVAAGNETSSQGDAANSTAIQDPNSVEAIQAALLAGLDPTAEAEATAAGANAAAGGGAGNEGSSFVRIARGGETASDAGLDFDTIAQEASSFTITGNESQIFQTNSLSIGSIFAFDNVGPDGQPADREQILNNAFTNDNTPTFTGTGAVPDSVIKIYDNGILIASVTVSADGSWEIDTPTLEEGSHSITITQQELGHTESDTAGPLVFTVDITPPESVAIITRLEDNVDGQQNLTDSSVIDNGGMTNDNSPNLIGNIDSPLEGGSVNIFRDGVLIGQAQVVGLNWSFQDSGLVDGQTYTYTVRVADASNNYGDLSNTYTISIDTSAPDQPVISQVLDDESDQVVPRGQVTDDATPVVSGQAPGASTITLYNKLANGELQIIAEDIPVEDGEWSYSPDIPLLIGDFELVTKSKDLAGNESPLSESYAFTVVIDSGDDPVIVNVIDDVAQYTGNVEKDTGITNDAQPEIVGTAKAGDLVTVYDTFNGERVVLGSATADVNGIWRLQLADDADVNTDDSLGDGTHNLTTISNLGTATQSSESGGYRFEVDTKGPEAIDDV